MAIGVRFSLAFLTLIICMYSVVSQEKKKSPEVTLYGEIIDSKCYLENAMGGGRGLEHKECAIQCAKSGIPLAFLEDKTETVYFLGRLNKMGSPNEMLLPFIAEHVAVTGKLFERGGAKMIMVDMVEKTGE